MGISHDSVNRFLLRESYEPQDLFNEAKKRLDVVGGTLNVDDTTLDKPYSHKMGLVAHFWSGKHHRFHSWQRTLEPAISCGYQCVSPGFVDKIWEFFRKSKRAVRFN